jgi:hypothetical protein
MQRRDRAKVLPEKMRNPVDQCQIDNQDVRFGAQSNPDIELMVGDLARPVEQPLWPIAAVKGRNVVAERQSFPVEPLGKVRRMGEM